VTGRPEPGGSLIVKYELEGKELVAVYQLAY
jgi:hypothetical protein